jgi:glycosyltransferase involved in cell wall biosynthesis
MFTIIIPLYNKAQYIEKAIRSVAAQSFKEFELIIVDDGSTDGGLDIVKRLAIDNLQLTIVEQPNSGVSTARNNGVKRAKYGYIAFLDADDWWLPSYLLEMKQLIAGFPEAALYASSYYKVKNSKNIPAKIGVSENFEQGYFDYCKAYATSLWMPVWTGATIVRKDVFAEMDGFKPHLKLGEDFDLWIRIALKYKIAFLNKPLAYYNQDVAQQGRAVGNLHDMRSHILWNVDYLAAEEQKNPDLKQLLDNLRVYGAFRYYMNKTTRTAALQELEKVDWTRQPKSTHANYYEMPIWYLKVRQTVLKMGCFCKTFLLKTLWKRN